MNIIIIIIVIIIICFINGQFPNCFTPLFQTRLSVKLFLFSLIQIQCKTQFHKKDFELSLVFES